MDEGLMLSMGESGTARVAESAPAGPDPGRLRLVIKAAFRCPEYRYYGALVLVLPDALDPNPSLYQVAGSKPEFGSPLPDTPWSELTGIILKYRYQAAGISQNAMAALEVGLPADNGFETLRSAAADPEELRRVLRARLAVLLGDRGCELTAAAEQVSQQALAGVQPAAAPPVTGLLRVQPVIDPMHGLPAHRFGLGDQLAVNLLGEDAIERALVDRFQERDERGKLVPRVAAITALASHEDETIEFTVAITDSIAGKAVVRKALKLRAVAAAALAPAPPARAESAPAAGGAPGPDRSLITAVAAAVVVTAIIMALFLFLVIRYWR